MAVFVDLRPERNKDGRSRLRVIQHLAGKRCYYNSRWYIFPEQFHKKTKTVINHPEQDLINKEMGELSRRIREIEDRLILQGKSVYPTQVKAEYNKMMDQTRNIINIYDDYVKEFIARGGRENSLANKQTVRTLLINYQEKHNVNLTFDQVNIEFIESFIADLLDGSLTPMKRPVSNSSIKTYITQISGFMRAAHEKKMHDNTDYLLFSTRTRRLKSKSKVKPRLTEEEVNLIYACDTSDIKWGELVKNLFVFMYETSLRLGDCVGKERIQVEDIIQDGEDFFLINRASEKTGQESIILLSARALEIIKKRGVDFGPIFEYIHTWNFNEAIKKIGCKAGLDREFVQIEMKGSQRKRKEGPLWKFLSAHAARHSYAQRMIDKGMNPTTLQNVMGHASIATTQKYFSARKNVIMDAQREIMKS